MKSFLLSHTMWNNEGDLRNGRHHKHVKCHIRVPSEVESHATHVDINTGVFYDARGLYDNTGFARILDRDTALWSVSEISIKNLIDNNYDFFNLMRKDRQGRLETRLPRF